MQHQQLNDKLHNTFRQLLQHLKDILNGYALPEPVYIADLRTTVERLFAVLKDPKLPLLELQVSEQEDTHATSFRKSCR